MMRQQSSFRVPSLCMLLFAVLLIGGCKKKPKVVDVQPQATAPAIITEPEPEPAEPAMPEPSARGDVVPPPPENTEPAPKPKPRRKPPSQVAKSTPPRAQEQPRAQEPAAPEPQQQAAAPPPPPISPTITAESPAQQHEVEQMLTKTEANVRSVTRELDDEEKAMLRQVESFVQQAREALKLGDLVRAHTLAQKAQLLSGELAKR